MRGAPSARAHEIPADVKINAFVRPTGDRIELPIGVPLAAMREVDFPTRGPGYLDLARIDEALRNATKLWLIDNIDVDENDIRLPAPRIVYAGCRSPRTAHSRRTSRRAHTCKGRRWPTTSSSTGNSNCSMCCSNTRSNPTALNSPSIRASIELGSRCPPRCASCRRTAPRARSSSTATRAWCGSIRAGTTPRCVSWCPASDILEGADHLLFLGLLVIPFRWLRPLVIIVTSFTVGHSISLAASALGFVPDALWFPPLVETLIAVTIVYMALENIVYAATGRLGGDLSRRWIIAFAFGVVHGFGFASRRQFPQFAGDHLVTALFGFNVGVEIGQIAVLLVLIPALDLLFRYVVVEWLGVIIMSALVAHVGWHWMIERGGELAKFPFPSRRGVPG